MKLYQYDIKLDKERRNSYLIYKENIECNDKRKVVDSPEQIWMLMEEVYDLSSKAEEYVYMLAVNSKYRIIGAFQVSKGMGNIAQLGVREVYMRALLIGASFIFIVHNHPSGDPSPSKEDIAVTERIKEAGMLLQVPVVDHIIIGENRYYSFREERGL